MQVYFKEKVSQIPWEQGRLSHRSYLHNAVGFEKKKMWMKDVSLQFRKKRIFEYSEFNSWLESCSRSKVVAIWLTSILTRFLYSSGMFWLFNRVRFLAVLCKCCCFFPRSFPSFFSSSASLYVKLQFIILSFLYPHTTWKMSLCVLFFHLYIPNSSKMLGHA